MKLVALWSVVAIELIALTLPVLSMAAGGEAHGDHHAAPAGAQWLTLIFTAINFSIFIYLLWRFAKDPIKDYLANQRAELLVALSAARDAKAEADRIREDYEAKLADLDKTRTAMIEELRTVAEADSKRVVQEAGEAAARMREEAERTARYDLERARLELRAEASRLAEEIAGREISLRLSDEDRGRLLDELIAEATNR